MVIGIDVAPLDCSYHGVALEKREVIDVRSSLDPREIADWCRCSLATVVAINGPSHWAPAADRLRKADEQLMAQEMTKCPTPAEGCFGPVAQKMLPGHEFFGAIADQFPLYRGGRARRRVAIETRVYACIVAIGGRTEVATQEWAEVMCGVGFDLKKFGCTYKAAIAAFEAQCFADDTASLLGDRASGHVAIPDRAKLKMPCCTRLVGPLKEPCDRCYGQLWVCEEHPYRPFLHCRECDGGGVGIPCRCNPEGRPSGIVIASAFDDSSRN